MQERSTPRLGTKGVSSYPYLVKRDVYNEETFQKEHRRKLSSSVSLNIDITTFKHHVKCSCSWKNLQKCLLTLFPCLKWACFYRFKDWFLGDIIAGITVGIVQIPQGLTLSLLTRQLIPPLNVAYGAFCSSIIYAIFGSCHHMSIGYFFLVSALMVNVLKMYPFNRGHLLMGTFLSEDFSQPHFLPAYNKSLSVVASTTLLTGIIQLTMGMLGFGFIATYLPEAIINAYLAATALHVVLSQFTSIFGLMITFHSGPVAFFSNLINYCIGIPKANSTSILLFLTAMVILRMNKCVRISFNQYPMEFPMEIFMIIIFTALSSRITMASETSTTLIEMIPYRYQLPVVPDLKVFPDIVIEAMSLAIVSSSLLIFMGKKFATFHNYKVNCNQDIIAIGLCNVVSSFFRSWVCTGAIIRTVIQDKTGGRQQFASMIGAIVMLLLMLKIDSFFHSMPNAILAGILLSNIVPYFQTICDLPNLWKQSTYDFVIWIFTFTTALFLGLDLGLLVSIIFTFFIITVRSHSSKLLILGQIPNTNIYRSFNDYREVVSLPGVKIVQCCNSITFVNVYHLKRLLLKETDLIKIPLKEENIHRMFKQEGTTSRYPNEKICHCACVCEEQEPTSKVPYTEIYESRQDHEATSLNLIHCIRFGSAGTLPDYYDQQIQCSLSNSGLQLQGQTNNETTKNWDPGNPSENVTVPDSPENQGQNRVPLYSDSFLQPGIHTIILDFTMVHFVDAQALIILRQMCNAFRNANILVLIAGCHSSVVRGFEINDFFDEGITMTQLFLTVHDAVLFALSRKLSDGSELSLDENETVVQDTFMETDKMDQTMSHTMVDYSQNKPSFMSMEPIMEEESDLDMDLKYLLDLKQDKVHGNEPKESELETESELEPEFVPLTQPKPKSMFAYPMPEYWPPQTSSSSISPSRTWTVVKRPTKSNKSTNT
ncbi:testis anion transporter 1 [Suncus etruscus]|uniref:testis anion transporter 1 n=1 Tax=Suncus etruscus TaxID=109475 RepID=UPI00210F800C|nr:testis anion transporter 1 [Suncus etruscus]